MDIKLLINMSNFRLNHVHIRLRYTELFISFILIRNNRVTAGQRLTFEIPYTVE